MNRWAGKVAVVTGASSGIGEAIAARLVEEGLKVVGVARRKERLESIANSLAGKKGQFFAFQADMTNEDDIVRAFAWTTENVGPVHILINNAGTFRRVDFLNLQTEDTKAILDLNVLGITIASREAVKILKENNINGHIININSLGGHNVVDFPGFVMYCASKHAVTALTESLSLEMKRLKIGTKVTSISPGLVETEIIDKEFMEYFKKNPEYCALKPNDIADAIVYVLSTPPNCQIDELTLRPIFVKE